MGRIVSVNGKIITPREGALSPSGQGFLSGFGLFETMPAYQSRIFRLDRHLQRLVSSAAALGIAGVEPGRLEEACLSAVTAAAEDVARIRLTVARRQQADEEPDVVVIAERYAPPPAEKYRDGVRAVVSAIRRASFSPLVRHKATSRLDCLLAREQALQAGYDEALFTNEKDNLTEGSIANLFLVDGDDALVTAPLEEGLLPGVMRQFVIESAREIGIAVRQECLPAGTISRYAGAFLTNSMFGILSLSAIDRDGTEYKFKPGRVVRRLSDAWRESTGQPAKG